ncbi:DUF6585 family protein [Alkanindiges sp. WGS2144]|uniref:DUF6585 family protein n=1 Tax=Alkanindiges sp. WGS2144 TaxID=3366808 RepID=UPI0037535C1A
MQFTCNNLTRFYWIILLVLFFPILSLADTPTGLFLLGISYLALLGFALNSMTRKIIVNNRHITCKNLFKEKSIRIIPESRIYICKNLHSLNLVYRHYDYRIKIINPNQTLTINANVNDADSLYALIAQLEHNVILPVWLERFHQKPSLRLDENLTLLKNGIQYKNKTYLYENLSGMELKNGHFQLVANGRLWQTPVLNLPVFTIPNLTTFMTLINHNEAA